MKISVLGGGHGARTVSAEMSLIGHQVTLYEMPQFQDNIKEIFKTKTIHLTGVGIQGSAQLFDCVTDIKQALYDPDLIFIVVPSLAHLAYAKLLAPYIKDGQHIILFPGTLGSLEFAEEFRKQNIQKDITISELDALPYATRITGSNTVNIFHKLPTFGIGVFPSIKIDQVLSLMQQCYPNIKPLKNVLEAGLSNANPIVHPLGVLLNAGRIEYSHGEFYYYEEGVTPSTARAMEAMDKERLAIGEKLGLSLTDASTGLYEVGYSPKGDLWTALKGSKGLTPIKGPTTLSNRYVTEDVPIGLVCWSQLGRQLGVKTNLMEATIHIAGAIANKDYFAEGRTLARIGIQDKSIQEILDYVTNGVLS